MGNPYLEKVAAVLRLPLSSNKIGSRVRSARTLAGKGSFGFEPMAKTPLIERIK